MSNLFLNIYCLECEFSKDCNNYKRGNNDDDKYGCVKTVPEDLYVEYCHQLYEVWAFAQQMDIDKERLCYIETIKVLEKINKCNTVNLLGKKGQILKATPK